MTYGIGGNTTGYNTHIEGTGGFCGITFETEQKNKDYFDKKRIGKILMPKKKGIKSVPNVAIVGSPTVNEDVISGFTTSDYATVSTIPIANSIEFGGKFSYSSSTTGVACIFEVSTTSYTGFNIAISDGSIRLWTDTEVAFGRQIEIAKDYWFKCECNSNGSILYLSTDSQNYTQEIYLAGNEFSSWTNSTFSLGVRNHNKTEAFTSGSIYLKDCYMKVNDKEFWTGMKEQQENVYLACR